MQKADIIIIGGGPGGYETATRAAAKGRKVILFEKDMLGGTCLNRGCIPTKCLCAAADIVHAIGESSDFGVDVAVLGVNYGKARRRADEKIGELRSGIVDILSNVEVVNAEAILMPDNMVEAGGEIYQADTLIIATGSEPARLSVPGSEYAITSDKFLAMDTLPERLLIIGGGVIGLEFASIAHAFGTEVTVLEFCREILPGCDADIAKRLRTYLTRNGIDIVVDAKVTAIEADGTVHYERKGKQATANGDIVLAAVGRRAVIPHCKEGLSLPLTERGFIATDNQYLVTKGMYAIGDVNGRCMLAHAAAAQGRVVLGEEVDMNVIPSVVFTHPECAFVSDNTAETKSIVRIPYSSNGKAVATGVEDGIVKLGIGSDSRLVSCAVVGSHAADLVAEATLAISARLTVQDIKRTIHAHPTLSELLSSALESIRES